MAGLEEKLKSQLFVPGEKTYAILDGASVPDLIDQLYALEPDWECLYRGELEPDIAEVAPYLVELTRGHAFTEWVITNGWGKHWGIFVLSPIDIKMLRRHFRTFLVVHDSEARPLYFRYYDPRVLRIYLPTCNATELKQVFGPVTAYIMEGENPDDIIRFGVDTETKLAPATLSAGKE
jgi:hypothetical protein